MILIVSLLTFTNIWFVYVFRFIDLLGLPILIDWLDSHSSPPVVQSVLDALANLTVTPAVLQKYPGILAALKPLQSHADESIRGTAEDLAACYEHIQSEGTVDEEDAVELNAVDKSLEHSKFSQIKIDVEIHHSKDKPVGNVVSEPIEDNNDPPTSIKDAVNESEGPRRKKSRGLSVRWPADDALTQVKTFYMHEIIDRYSTSNDQDRAVNKQLVSKESKGWGKQRTQVSNTPWKPPPRLILPDAIQTQFEQLGCNSTERAAQTERERRVLSKVFYKIDDLPPDPEVFNDLASDASEHQVKRITFKSFETEKASAVRPPVPIQSSNDIMKSLHSLASFFPSVQTSSAQSTASAQQGPLSKLGLLPPPPAPPVPPPSLYGSSSSASNTSVGVAPVNFAALLATLKSVTSTPQTNPTDPQLSHNHGQAPQTQVHPQSPHFMKNPQDPQTNGGYPYYNPPHAGAQPYYMGGPPAQYSTVSLTTHTNFIFAITNPIPTFC